MNLTEVSAVRQSCPDSASQFSEYLTDRQSVQPKPSLLCPEFAPYDIGDLFTGDFTDDFLIEGALVAKQPLLLCGPRKALKTGLLLELAVCGATGAKFLGRFNVNRRFRSLLMSGESGLGTIRNTLLAIFGAKGYSREEAIESLRNDIVVVSRVPKLGNTQHENTVRQLLDHYRPDVLAIDPAYCCLSGTNAANVFEQGAQLNDLTSLAADGGAQLILAHHAKKTRADERYQMPELGDEAFAGFSEWARQWLYVNFREAYCDKLGLHRLWLNLGGSAGHSSRWALDVEQGPLLDGKPRYWQSQLSSAEGVIEERQQRRASEKEERTAHSKAKRVESKCAKLKRYLREHGADTRRCIMEALGRSAESTEALEKTLSKGEIIPCRVTKGKNQEYDGFKLA